MSIAIYIIDNEILHKLNIKNLTKTLNYLISNNKIRSTLQKLSIKNFYLTHKFVSNLIEPAPVALIINGCEVLECTIFDAPPDP